MAIIWRSHTNEGAAAAVPTSAAQAEWVYNGLDCCVTREVYDVLVPKLNEITGRTYEFSRQLMAPILEMELRGVLIDQEAKREIYDQCLKDHNRVMENLSAILCRGLGINSFNPGSWQQKQWLLYEVLGLPPVHKKGKITTDRSALEKCLSYFHAESICRHIITVQELRKKLGFLKTGVDSDGRMRTTFNVGGTDTGRLSSSESVWGSGTNLQNIAPEMRRMFIADPGYRMAYVDLEQAEARGVGAIIWNLFHDPKYLDFCESGDLHTNVTMMTWENLPWSQDMKENKAIALRRFYREFSYRYTSKRLGHASNYKGKPPQISKEVRIPINLVADFQVRYFKLFPGIPRFHEAVRQQLLRHGFITTFMGRQRWFFGRRWEDETLRSAIAYEPQSAIADYLDEGMLRVWRSGVCQILLQEHDALLIQYPEEQEHEVIPAVQRLMEIEVELMYGRKFVIPTEAKVGWNWGEADDSNPDGLVEYHVGRPDLRTRSKATSFLDRLFL